MSTQSSFQSNHISDLFSILHPEPPSASSNKKSLKGEYSLSPEPKQTGQRQQTRPLSEILKPEVFTSPENDALDKWYNDLQQYERNLEAMASANVDPKFKEEVHHVDQWFYHLNPAERTATIYTLLQHSSQVQIRFFVSVLQQMCHRDPLGALLSPPEKVDTQLAGTMAKLEFEASQKLISVLPYQTGQVIARPPVPNRRAMDRHSFAMGDAEEFDRLFSKPGLLNSGFGDTRHFDSARPKSVMLDSEHSSIFSKDWPYTAGLDRPKSADVSQWFNAPSIRESEIMSTWTPKAPFAPESSKTPFSTDPGKRSLDGDQNRNQWNNNRRSRAISRNSVPSTVSETDEKQPTSILLSMFEDGSNNTLFSEPFIPSASRSVSPVPSQNQGRLSVPGAKQFGQLLIPTENEGYASDHSDHSTTSKNTRRKSLNVSRQKEKKNSDLDMQILEDVPAWLRSLRLHKYNNIFVSMKWQDMLKLNDQELLIKGVAALGARRKLLKVFDQVKSHCETNNIKY